MKSTKSLLLALAAGSMLLTSVFAADAKGDKAKECDKDKQCCCCDACSDACQDTADAKKPQK